MRQDIRSSESRVVCNLAVQCLYLFMGVASLFITPSRAQDFSPYKRICGCKCLGDSVDSYYHSIPLFKSREACNSYLEKLRVLYNPIQGVDKRARLLEQCKKDVTATADSNKICEFLLEAHKCKEKSKVRPQAPACNGCQGMVHLSSILKKAINHETDSYREDLEYFITEEEQVVSGFGFCRTPLNYSCEGTYRLAFTETAAGTQNISCIPAKKGRPSC